MGGEREERKRNRWKERREREEDRQRGREEERKGEERERRGEKEETQGGWGRDSKDRETRRKGGKEERTREREQACFPSPARSDGVNCSEERRKKTAGEGEVLREIKTLSQRDPGRDQEAENKERKRRESQKEGIGEEDGECQQTHSPANTLPDTEGEQRRKAATRNQRQTDTGFDAECFVLPSEHLPRCPAGDSSATSDSRRGCLVTVTGACKCSMTATPKRG